jgi:predicted pyridoxine 5'-phosphate oxidase superfamily flavin-nucleotide-binding protein
LRHESRDGRGPQMKEKKMSQLITRKEVECLDEGVLQSRFSQIMQDLIRTQMWQFERTQALASLGTVQTELNRKRALKSRISGPKF